MATEGRLEEDCIEHAKARGWLYRKITYKGRRGAPDRWFLKAGRWVVVEFKSPTGEGRLAVLQRREHERLRKQGQVVHLIDSFKAFCDALGE